jgi:hypothetical protein
MDAGFAPQTQASATKRPRAQFSDKVMMKPQSKPVNTCVIIVLLIT